MRQNLLARSVALELDGRVRTGRHHHGTVGIGHHAIYHLRDLLGADDRRTRLSGLGGERFQKASMLFTNPGFGNRWVSLRDWLRRARLRPSFRFQLNDVDFDFRGNPQKLLSGVLIQDAHRETAAVGRPRAHIPDEI